MPSIYFNAIGPHPTFFRDNFGGQWKEHDSFKAVYTSVTQPFRRHIIVNAADLSKEFAWGGKRIEILGIDVWKTQEIPFATAKSFFPHLQTGALVLHQDYRHIWLPWAGLFNALY